MDKRTSARASDPDAVPDEAAHVVEEASAPVEIIVPHKTGMVSDEDWEAALAMVEAEGRAEPAPERSPERARVIEPPIIRPRVVEPSDKLVGDIDMAERTMRMQKLGLDPGLNHVQRARMTRIDLKVMELQKLVSPQQFAMVLNTLRSQKGDIEEALDTLVGKAKDGTLFVRPVEPGPNLGQNRSQRRGHATHARRRRR